jgi:hypothetical protein
LVSSVCIISSVRVKNSVTWQGCMCGCLIWQIFWWQAR